MDKTRLAQAIIEALDGHLADGDIGSIDGSPQTDAQGNLFINLTRHVRGGFRQPPPIVEEVCRLTLTFERRTIDPDADPDVVVEPF